MSTYLYRLRQPKQKTDTRYSRDELQQLTTLQLREICYHEKLIAGMTSTLDREKLIQTIVKYRGIKEYALITDYKEDGLMRVTSALQKYLGKEVHHSGKIRNPAAMTLYKGLSVDKTDCYQVETGGMLEESNVLLVDDQWNVCTILNVRLDEPNKQIAYLYLGEGMQLEQVPNRNYQLLYFEPSDSKYLYNVYYEKKASPPPNLNYYRVPIEDLEIRELEETRTILAIDFGTSNTTTGAYLSSDYITQPCENDILNGKIQLDAINFVKFSDLTEDKEEARELLPTVVVVQKCDDPKQVQYKFGYEALVSTQNSSYNTSASMFYEIKRWVSSYKQKEEITDIKGNIAYVQRSEIIRAYIGYVIERAEHQFKCRFKNIHISSPVRLKQQFLHMFVEIMPKYHVETENALDEGIAVLYNTIANQIDKNSFIDGQEYQALIIDCGGGTTDLSSCTFRIEDDGISYNIDIHTTYENGDTLFGGNNITYRVMQYIKVLFAQYYSGQPVPDIEDVMGIPSIDIFRYVDEHGVAHAYESLEKHYEKAEEIIPTQFKAYQNRTREEYQMVKRNFYFLWNIAEKMKKEFFKKAGVLRSAFHAKGIKTKENDIKITAVETWCLALRKSGVLTEVYEYPEVIFNINEINTLIQADIYGIVKRFLEGFYEDHTLQDYDIIKLTGQSCRIDVFKDAIKEFIPGRSIEFRNRDNNLLDLKLSCLSGVLRYVNAKKVGYIDVNIQNLAPVTPYSVSALTHNGTEKTLIASLEKINQTNGCISRHIQVKEMAFFLKDANGDTKYKYIYQSHIQQYEKITYEEINGIYSDKICQDEIDTIVDGEVKFFVFAYEDQWGFYVLPIARQETQLYMGEKRFYSFENDQWELDFFDGLK